MAENRKRYAATFGQDLMRGEHIVGAGGQVEDKTSQSKDAAAPSGLTWTGAAASFDHYRVIEGTRDETQTSGTSIFDPVLTELNYRWFCPPGGVILDPFAGGSVRGIVASKLGRRYIGIDLSARQIEANRIQAQELCTEADPIPNWIVGDSRDIETLVTEQADFIWTCHPAGTLISTSKGLVPIENLTTDNKVITHKGRTKKD